MRARVFLWTLIIVGPGAVAVWASSGLTDSLPQGALNRALLSALFGSTPMTVGQAAAAAKAATPDLDVRRTWTFLGDPPMNVLPAMVRRDGDKPVIVVEGTSLPVSPRLARTLEDAHLPEEVLIGLKPGDIKIGLAADEAGAIPAELYSSEALHRKTVVCLSVTSGLVKINAPVGFQGKVGDKSWISADTDNAYFFDAQTGSTLAWPKSVCPQN